VGLRKWQRNLVFEAVNKARLSPDEFDFDLGGDEERLTHRQSGAYFVFGGVAGAYTSKYVAGDGPIEERADLSQLRLMQQVELWLAALRQDIDTPDLWAQLQHEAELLAGISDDAVDNTALTLAEQEEIATQLRGLRDYVGQTHSLSEVQMRLLDERLDYLTAAAGRVGRKDWLLMAVGMVLSYAAAAALPPDTALDIFRTLVTSIGHILVQGHLRLP
jgi:hypothetical protein